MKTLSSKITAISDPMQVAGEIQVLTGEYNQIYNPSAQVYEPNRMINPTKLAASITGVDPNSTQTLEVESAEWHVDGTRINSGNEKYVLRNKDDNKSDNIYLDIYANGDTNGSAMAVECIMSYINKTTGIKETVRAERVLTTTVHDTYHLALAATTETEAVMNPMKDGDKRVQDFGCKLMAGQMQVPADYYWYVRTMNNGTPSDVKVTGTESWFKGAKHYEYTTDANGEIIADSWELNDGGEIGTWATITVDVAKTDKLMLVCKAVPTYTGVDPQNKLQNNYQQVFRSSMELPVLKKVKMHAIQGYTTKHNADVTATHFKAYVDIFVGSQELNGNDENERSTIDEFFSVIWYKRINNKSTIIGYGAPLDVTYEQLGIRTTSVNNINAIDETTIPEIYAEVSENYISGGVQGAVYSNYEKPNPKAVFGNDSIADELAAYLVETTYNEDGTTTIDAKRLMKNNWFRYENDQPAPTMLCNEAQYANIMTIPENEREYNNNGEWTYLGVPVACYNPPEKNSKPSGINLNLDILYGWSEPVWTVEMHTNNSGEVVCYFAKEPFEIEEDGKVLEAVKIPPTLISPGLPTLCLGDDGKKRFRTMFFMPNANKDLNVVDNCAKFGFLGSKGIGGISMFYGTQQSWVATGISNNNNNTYSFAKNKDANSDNTPYAPLMHWHYNNILCALETKFKSAILHDDSMFGRGISSNPQSPYLNQRTYTNVNKDDMNVTPQDVYYKDSSGELKQANWSTLLSNQGSRMICLEPQLVVSWAVEQYTAFGKSYDDLFEEDWTTFYCSLIPDAVGFTIKGIGRTDWDYTMNAIVTKRYFSSNSIENALYDSTGNLSSTVLDVHTQTSCVHGIDLVSADVFQCQNGIENILTVEQEGNVDGNPRTIWICKDQTKLYRGTETVIASGEKYPFETDGTYELLGESKKTQGWGNNFLRGTCIPTEDGGSLSKISGYYYAINYGNTTKGNRNRICFRGRGYASVSNASARCVTAVTAVSNVVVSSAGGFQIRLPEPTTNDIE